MADLPIDLLPTFKPGRQGHYLRPSPAERLAAGIEVDPFGGCWLWSRAVFPSGYGAIRVGGRSVGAHRLAYTLAHGPIPAGEGVHGTCVLHRCDVPACCNPDHLFLGTNSQNTADKVAKGRQAVVRGERNGFAKLNEPQAAEVRRLALAGDLTQAEIGRRFNVAQSTVMAIKSGRNWRALAQTGVAPPVPEET